MRRCTLKIRGQKEKRVKERLLEKRPVRGRGAAVKIRPGASKQSGLNRESAANTAKIEKHVFEVYADVDDNSCLTLVSGCNATLFFTPENGGSPIVRKLLFNKSTYKVGFDDLPEGDYQLTGTVNSNGKKYPLLVKTFAAVDPDGYSPSIKISRFLHVKTESLLGGKAVMTSPSTVFIKVGNQ